MNIVGYPILSEAINTKLLFIIHSKIITNNIMQTNTDYSNTPLNKN